jgi:hypothetical protein
MTPKRRKIVGWTVLILLPIAYLVASEVHYARSISPRAVHDVADYFQRFGEPLFVQLVERDGKSYYEFSGRLPPWFSLATPSAPPAYIFDAQGRFVEWCSDPGDTAGYRARWPLSTTGRVDVLVVRQKFGI